MDIEFSEKSDYKKVVKGLNGNLNYISDNLNSALGGHSWDSEIYPPSWFKKMGKKQKKTKKKTVKKKTKKKVLE